MEIDKTTLNDLAVFNAEEEFSLFRYLDHTTTTNGKEQLKINLQTPLQTPEAINGIQQTLKLILQKQKRWPGQISNGSVMVVERFYDSRVDMIPANVSATNAYSYKLLHGPDFSLVKYSITHCFDFIKGNQKIPRK